MSIELLQNCFVSAFDLYKKYSSFLVWFLSFFELFLAFSCAKEIANLVSIWFGVSIVSRSPCWLLLCAADSSLSKSGMSVVSGCSSEFCFLNFVLSAILSSNFGS